MVGTSNQSVPEMAKAAERSLGSLEAELESHQDETRSLASLTEPTSLLEGTVRPMNVCGDPAWYF